MNANKSTDGDCILEVKRSRLTGAHIIVEFLPSVDEAQPWHTTCITHGGVCSHESRALAVSFARVSDEWCEDCQAAMSTEGQESWDDFA